MRTDSTARWLWLLWLSLGPALFCTTLANLIYKNDGALASWGGAATLAPSLPPLVFLFCLSQLQRVAVDNKA